MEVSSEWQWKASNGAVADTSDEDGELFCQPCYSDGDRVIAVGYCQNCNEFLCVTCLEVHREQTTNKNQTSAGKKNLQTLSEAIDACSEVCSVHNTEIIKFYCSFHDVVGCGDCMVLDHKSCKIDRIQEISQKFYDGPEHKHLLQTVENLEKDIEQIKNEIQANKTKIDHLYSKAIDDIKHFRKRINAYLDVMESAVIDELNMRKENDMKTITEVKEMKTAAEFEAKEIHQKLSLQYLQANELFVTATQMKNDLPSVDAQIKQLIQLNNITEYRFEESNELEEILRSKTSLGKVTECEKASISRKRVGDMKPTFFGEINMKSDEDYFDCNVLSTALITPTIIAVADSGNRCVKLIDTDKRIICGSYKFNCYPVDIAVVSENEIAVTLPDERSVAFLFVSKQYTLSLSRTFKAQGRCTKISCKNDLTLLSYDSGSVDILDNRGSVLETPSYLYHPESLTFAHEPDVLFASRGDTVTKHDFDGNVMANFYNPDLCPDGNTTKESKAIDTRARGLTILQDDTVFVCNWFSNWKINVLSSDCEKIAEILCDDKHVHPCCVSFSEESNKLFVCNNVPMLSPELKNTMKIFQLK